MRISLTIFSLLILSACSPSTYQDCVDDVVKNAKTDIAVRVGTANCADKFESKPNLVADCSATWNGAKFISGSPMNPEGYNLISITNTTHKIYLPKDMDKETMGKIMEENFAELKKICPIKDN